MDKPTLRKEIPLIIEKLEKSRNSLCSECFTSIDELQDKLIFSICSEYNLTLDKLNNLPADERKRMIDETIKRFSPSFSIEDMINNIKDIQVSEEWKNESAKETLDAIHGICEDFEIIIEIEGIISIIDEMLASLNRAVSEL